MIFEKLPEGEQEKFSELAAAYNLIFPDLRCVAAVSRLPPGRGARRPDRDQDGRSRREMEDVTTNLAIPGYVRDLLRGFLSEEREPLTLHLNADNPTIQKLAARENLRDEVSRHALVSLYNNALMLLARALRVKDVQTMFEQYNQVIEMMLSLAAERNLFESELNAKQIEVEELRRSSNGDQAGMDPYVSCFVAMPFRDPRAAEIYQAIRAVLEDHPYFWRVVRADDTAEKAGLWDNLKTKLLRAHCYISILTGDLNPNVMIEIGRMEALQRPMLLLRDPKSPPMPADLTGRLYVDLGATGSGLVEEVREALTRQEELHKLQGTRFLSETAVRRYASLDPATSARISMEYPTWEAFIQADSNVVAAKLGINRFMVQAAQNSLSEVE